IVITSYWPPLVAMSVVTRSRSTFSSSVTQLSWISGFFEVKSSVSFCMRIMSPLLTVAMVIDSAYAAKARALAVHRLRASVLSFIQKSSHGQVSICLDYGQLFDLLVKLSSWIQCCAAP